MIVGEGPHKHVLLDLTESLGLADRVVITESTADIASRPDGKVSRSSRSRRSRHALVATDARGTREGLT